MRCSVTGVIHTGELTNQCNNETEETVDYADIVDEINVRWHNKDMRQVLTGTAICEMHLNQIDDI